MSIWASVKSLMPQGRARGSRAALALTQAYRNLFEGRATKAEAQMVLADLAKHSDFYQGSLPAHLCRN